MDEIAVISDIHLRRELEAEIVAAIEDCLSYIEHHTDVSYVFVLGDLITHSRSVEEDKQRFRTLRAIFDNYQVSPVWLLGNHDVMTVSRPSIGDILDQEKFFGQITIGSRSILYLDTSWPESQSPNGFLDRGQLEWVKETVEERKNVVILLHHPVGFFNLDNNPWFRHYPERAYLANRKELHEILTRNNTTFLTISGHIHATQLSESPTMPHISINAFSNERPSKPLTGEFAIVRFDEGVSIEIRNEKRVLRTYHVDEKQVRSQTNALGRWLSLLRKSKYTRRVFGPR
ncbi:metallophosphoesterase family protein [Natrarchaeobius chitinivorans]|uniref:Calcineurin-like phosphoesterase domain-containing protein n=1 Tax=Natrarchaeobius chitinivorans TaxID=1679083 RepID=A0A3N6P7U4_NATCH|nr:metallophosphoesterase [Natrarchaeobius chitinivorans]RQG92065.1 hypothetical protein EA473_17550 [Natrarchaeobius chitinivorans]